jgi:hypothetical protein
LWGNALAISSKDPGASCSCVSINNYHNWQPGETTRGTADDGEQDINNLPLHDLTEKDLEEHEVNVEVYIQLPGNKS